ncbi:MAG: hypothetical protein ACT4NY_31475 [Pseudonocardiales bacterium]
MIRTVSRVAILLGALAVAGVLVGCGQEPAASGPAPGSTTAVPSTPEHGAGHISSTTEVSTTPAGPTGRTINITVSGGQVTGETGRVEVPLGTPVTVTSDVADEIHVHGGGAYPVPAARGNGRPHHGRGRPGLRRLSAFPAAR